MYITHRSAIVVVLFCLFSSFAAGELLEFEYDGEKIAGGPRQVDLINGRYIVEDDTLEITITGSSTDLKDLQVGLRIRGDVDVAHKYGGTLSQDGTKTTFKIPREAFSKEVELWIGRGDEALFLSSCLFVAEAKGRTQKWKSVNYIEKSYDTENNKGYVILTPTGNIIHKDLDLFDENDTLVVTIVGDRELLSQLKVKRISPFRRKGTVRLVGEEVEPPIERKALEEPEYDKMEFTVQDFEPGKGEIEISVIGDPDRVIGTFEFNVNPLYTGIISYGGVWTRAVDPDYKLVTGETEEAENILIEGNAGERDLLYSLLYTPYIWGKRDLEKIYPWYNYINPTVGIVPNDITNHALLGVSIDLPIGGTLFTVGAHVRRIDALSEDTKAEIGETYAAGKDADDVELPTSRELKTDLFLAVSVDLRAAVRVVRAALSVAAGND